MISDEQSSVPHPYPGHPSPPDQPSVSLTCPPESELLRFALLDDRSGDATADHLAGCAGCRERVSMLCAVVSGVRAGTGTAPSGGCLDEVALARYVEGLDPEVGRRARH